MVREIKAPESISNVIKKDTLKIFLAGSIDMGQAINWQQNVVNQIVSASARGLNSDITILNPRRDDWDSSWIQDIENPQFNQQVNWELNAMDHCDIIIMVITRDSKAPITLLEFGLHALSGKLMIVVEEGFYRKGNIDIVCNKYGIPQYSSIYSLINDIKL